MAQKNAAQKSPTANPVSNAQAASHEYQVHREPWYRNINTVVWMLVIVFVLGVGGMYGQIGILSTEIKNHSARIDLLAKKESVESIENDVWIKELSRRLDGIDSRIAELSVDHARRIGFKTAIITSRPVQVENKWRITIHAIDASPNQEQRPIYALRMDLDDESDPEFMVALWDTVHKVDPSAISFAQLKRANLSIGAIYWDRCSILLNERMDSAILDESMRAIGSNHTTLALKTGGSMTSLADILAEKHGFLDHH